MTWLTIGFIVLVLAHIAGYIILDKHDRSFYVGRWFSAPISTLIGVVIAIVLWPVTIIATSVAGRQYIKVATTRRNNKQEASDV